MRRHIVTIVLVGGYLLYVALCLGYLALSVAQHGDQSDANIGAGLALLALSIPWTPLIVVADGGILVYAVVVGGPLLNLALLAWFGRWIDGRAARPGPRRPA